MVERTWERLRADRADEQVSPSIPNFPNRDHWFLPEVQHDLALLRDALRLIEDDAIREFFLVVYSSIIVAKGPSTVANALDIAHSRAHYVQRMDVPDVIARFRDRFRRALRAMQDFHEWADRSVHIEIKGEDARTLPYPPRSIDFILTSPPYVTAIEYPRSHKFSVWWIADLLGIETCAYDRLRSRYIGTENVSRAERLALGQIPAETASIHRVTSALDAVDAVRAGRVRRYFREMRLALAEMLRVLKPDAFVVLIVASSSLRGIPVPTARCLVDLAEQVSIDGAVFVHRDTLERPIREQSRQLPIKRGTKGDGMRTENIVILQRRYC